MSRRTLWLAPLAALGVTQAWLVVRSGTTWLGRAPMVVAFVSVAAFCASWLADGDRPQRGD